VVILTLKKQDVQTMKKFVSAVVLGAMLFGGAPLYADSIGSKVALWLPNRIVDLFDIFSVSLGLGASVRAELMATEYCKVGGGSSWIGGLIKAHHRQYGVGVRNGWYWSLIAAQQEAVEMVGLTPGVHSYTQEVSDVDVPMPTDVVFDFYEGDRDFWRIGGALGLLLEGELYIHPVEIADFITGIFFIDISADDYTLEDFE